MMTGLVLQVHDNQKIGIVLEYLPNGSLHLLSGEHAADLCALAPFLGSFEAPGPRARAHLCRGESCENPVEGPEELRALLIPES